MSLRRFLFIVVLLALAMSSVAVIAQSDMPQRGGTVSGVCVAALTSLDPQSTQLGVCDRIAYDALYNQLIRINTAGEILPEIAESWDVSDDGLNYTFHIRSGVSFHDGSALDAEAVKFTIDRMRDPESESYIAGRLTAIEEVNVIDEVTVEVVLNSFNAPFLSTLAGATTIVSPAAVAEYGDDYRFNAVGSGPFKLVSWTPGEEAVLERNENYWEVGADGEPLPYLDSVVLTGIEDNTVRLLNLQSGEFDLNERVLPRDVPTIESDADLKVIETVNATAYTVTFNTSQPPFDDVRLRLAAQAALQPDALIENLSEGIGYYANFPFPLDAWYWVEQPRQEYDPELARQLLAEAGYPDGIDVVYTHINRTVDAQMAQIVQAMLAQVGIRIEIQALERTSWLDIWLVGAGENTEGEMAGFQNGVAPGDPDGKAMFFQPGGIVNFADYNNEVAWGRIEDSRTTLDQAERARAWADLVEIQLEEAPYVWVGNIPVIGAARERVQDITLTPSSGWLLTRTWVNDA